VGAAVNRGAVGADGQHAQLPPAAAHGGPGSPAGWAARRDPGSRRHDRRPARGSTDAGGERLEAISGKRGPKGSPRRRAAGTIWLQDGHDPGRPGTQGCGAVTFILWRTGQYEPGVAADRCLLRCLCCSGCRCC
jgi:hypothetical protein